MFTNFDINETLKVIRKKCDRQCPGEEVGMINVTVTRRYLLLMTVEWILLKESRDYWMKRLSSQLLCSLELVQSRGHQRSAEKLPCSFQVHLKEIMKKSGLCGEPWNSMSSTKWAFR